MDLDHLEIDLISFSGAVTFLSVSKTYYLHLPSSVVKEMQSKGFLFDQKKLYEAGQKITLRVIYDEKRPERAYYVFLHTKPRNDLEKQNQQERMKEIQIQKGMLEAVENE